MYLGILHSIISAIMAGGSASHATLMLTGEWPKAAGNLSPKHLQVFAEHFSMSNLQLAR